MSSIVGLLAAAMLVLCIVRLLVLRPPPAAKLPHPSKVPGLPMTGPASIAAAHAAITRRAPRPWWRVW